MANYGYPGGGVGAPREDANPVVEMLRAARAGDQFLLDGQVVTFRHLNNPNFPNFVFFEERQRGVAIAELTPDRIRLYQRVEDLDRTQDPPPPGAAPGLLVVAVHAELNPEEIARLYAIYEQIPEPNARIPRLTAEQFAQVLGRDLADRDLAEFQANQGNLDDFLNPWRFGDDQVYNGLLVRLWLILPDYRNRHYGVPITANALRIATLLQDEVAVTNNLELHRDYPATVAALEALNDEEYTMHQNGPEFLVPGLQQRVRYRGFSAGTVSDLSFYEGLRRNLRNIDLAAYLEFLRTLTTLRNVYTEVRPKLPNGIQFLDFAEVILRMDAQFGEAEVAQDQVRGQILHLLRSGQDSDFAAMAFAATLENLRQRRAQGAEFTDSDLVTTLRLVLEGNL